MTERKTGSMRKTGSLRNREKGAGPLVLFTTALGLGSQTLGFFSLFYAFRDNQQVVLFLFSLGAPLAGAAVWNRLCKRNGWPFQTGGPDHDPFGIYAFVWGLVSFFPVAFCARILTSNYRLNSPLSVLRWFSSSEFGQILLFSALAGIAAIAFYGFSRRHALRSLLQKDADFSESFELLITALWAFLLSALPVVALGLIHLGRAPKPEWSLQSMGYALPAAFSVLVCLLLLSAYFYFFEYRRLDPKGMFKGFVIEFGLSFSVFWGLWLLMDWRRFESVSQTVGRFLGEPF